MEIKISSEVVEGMMYHTEDPERIYNILLDMIKPDIMKNIEYVIEKKNRDNSKEAKPVRDIISHHGGGRRF